MEGTGMHSQPVEIIKPDEKREGYTIGPTSVSYAPLQLQRHLQSLAEQSLPQAEAESLAQNTKVYFDLFSYFRHIYKHSPLTSESLKNENATPLAGWSKMKQGVLSLMDFAHATELVFPNSKQPAIMINLRKIERDLSDFKSQESREAALQAVLGEYWRTGCEQIIELQNPQKKILGGIQKVAQKAGIGTGVGMLNFATTVLPVHGVPFPYSVAVGPAVNVVVNMLRRKKTNPVSNPDSVLFEVHHNPKIKGYTPLPPFVGATE